MYVDAIHIGAHCSAYTENGTHRHVMEHATLVQYIMEHIATRK